MICRSRDFRPVPVSRKLRSKWCEDSMGLASNLVLYSSTPLDAALRMPASVIKDFFESKAFEDWKKNREAEGRMQSAIVDRLNEIIRGCGIIAKTVARAR